MKYGIISRFLQCLTACAYVLCPFFPSEHVRPAVMLRICPGDRNGDRTCNVIFVRQRNQVFRFFCASSAVTAWENREMPVSNPACPASFRFFSACTSGIRSPVSDARQAHRTTAVSILDDAAFSQSILPFSCDTSTPARLILAPCSSKVWRTPQMTCCPVTFSPFSSK